VWVSDDIVQTDKEWLKKGGPHWYYNKTLPMYLGLIPRYSPRPEDVKVIPPLFIIDYSGSIGNKTGLRDITPTHSKKTELYIATSPS
jgi:hypothetical protein